MKVHCISLSGDLILTDSSDLGERGLKNNAETHHIEYIHKYNAKMAFFSEIELMNNRKGAHQFNSLPIDY